MPCHEIGSGTAIIRILRPRGRLLASKPQRRRDPRKPLLSLLFAQRPTVKICCSVLTIERDAVPLFPKRFTETGSLIGSDAVSQNMGSRSLTRTRLMTSQTRCRLIRKQGTQSRSQSKTIAFECRKVKLTPEFRNPITRKVVTTKVFNPSADKLLVCQPFSQRSSTSSTPT
jgi:hypothetical protein